MTAQSTTASSDLFDLTDQSDHRPYQQAIEWKYSETHALLRLKDLLKKTAYYRDGRRTAGGM